MGAGGIQTALSAPSNFIAVGISTDQISISWDDVANATTYTLQRADNAGFTIGLTSLYTGPLTNFDDVPLPFNTTYYYRVKASGPGYLDSEYSIATGNTLVSNLFLGGNEFEFGDSYMVGTGASPIENAYNRKLREYLQSDVTDKVFSAGGSGVYKMVSSSNASINEYSAGVVIAQCMFNDVRRQLVLAETLEKIKGAYRVFIMNALAKTYHDINSFAATGSTTPIGVGVFGNKFGLKYNAGPATFTKTISGQNFGIALLGSSGDTYTFGTQIIKIDGIEVFNESMTGKTDGVSDGIYNNEITPWGIFILGLAPGPHDFEFISDDQNLIDFVVELVDFPTEYTNTVLCVGAALMPDAGYLVAPANADEAMMISANDVLQDVVNEVKEIYPVSFIDISDLNKLTDFDPDNVHINNSGHLKVYNKINALISINNSFLLFSQLKDIIFWNGYYQSKNSSTWQSYGLSGLYLPAGIDGFVQFDIENLTDANFGMVGLNLTETLETFSGYEYAAAFYDADLRRLTNGGGFTVVQPGPLTIGGKVRLGRFGGSIKIRYAADGSNFIDIQDWGADGAAFYLNIAMVEDKKAYGLLTSGFIAIP